MFSSGRFTPHQQAVIADRVAQIYAELNEEILGMIAKRLKTKGIEKIAADSVFEWQLEKLSQVGGLNKEATQAIARATKRSQKAIREVIEEVGYKTIDATDKDLRLASMGQLGAPLTPVSDIDNILSSFINQTFLDFNNFVNQSLISTSFGSGTVAKVYEDIISRATTQVLAGITTTQNAIRKTILEWVDSGIPSGFIDKSGRTWSMERYARTTIRSTVNRTYNELRISRMEEFGTELVVVSSLPDPREICSLIQGGIASLKPIAENDSKYPSIYEFGYGTPGGIRGVNCRHMFFPYFEGISENNQKQYTEQEMTQNREDAKRQTALESQIRKAKRKQMVAQQLGDDKLAEHYRKQVRDRQASMRAFIDESGRGRRYNREQVYGIAQ